MIFFTSVEVSRGLQRRRFGGLVVAVVDYRTSGMLVICYVVVVVCRK
jgi:Na+/glutamate symporter